MTAIGFPDERYRDWWQAEGRARLVPATGSVSPSRMMPPARSAFGRATNMPTTNPSMASPPAVVNAVIDALAPFGLRHADMPLTPAQVWLAVQGRPVRTDLAFT